jgi:hypothetical protein
LKGAILHRYDEVILNRPTSWGIKEHGCSPAGLDWLFNVDVILQRISRTWFKHVSKLSHTVMERVFLAIEYHHPYFWLAGDTMRTVDD